jgi:hypothetical protein
MNVVSVGAGAVHGIAAKSDGTLWTWGSDTDGQLGNGITYPNPYSPYFTPSQVVGMSNVTAVAAGAFGSVALKSDGTVWFSGYMYYNPAQSPYTFTRVAGMANIQTISFGQSHIAALDSTGNVWTYGGGHYGELGNGTSDVNAFSSTAVQVPGMSSVISVAAGYFHTVAAKSDGTVWAWGRNDCGQVGNGTVTPTPTNSPGETGIVAPVQVSGLSNVVAVAAGGQFSMALKSDGSVWAWGSNAEGQLGISTATAYSDVPVRVPGLPAVSAIACGSAHSVAQLPGGTVWQWGSGGSPAPLAGVVQTVAIAAGGPAVDSGGPDSSPFTFVLATGATVSGAVTFQSYTGYNISADDYLSLSFNFRPESSSAAFTRTLTVFVAGGSVSYTLIGVPIAPYQIAFDSAKYLRKDVLADASTGAVTGVDASLIPGDVNGDNVIDLTDFGLFAAAFGTSVFAYPPDGYNPDADLNGDGYVDLNDFGILAQNFGLAGDP